MGLYNFQPRFSPKILDRSKRHTIRQWRKYPDKPGDTMHLYEGLRHPGATLLGRHPCTWTGAIAIGVKGAITVDGVCISGLAREELARADGFSSWDEMIEYWAAHLPFMGQILGWDPTVVVPARIDPRTHLARDAKLSADRGDPPLPKPPLDPRD